MKKLILSLLLGCATTFAAVPPSYVPNAASTFELNRSGAAAAKHSLGNKIKEAHTTAVGTYDVAIQTGATGTYSVGITLPNKAVVRKVWTDAPTAGIGSGAALDFLLVPGQTGATNRELTNNRGSTAWTGIQDGRLDGAVANFIKPSAASSVIARVNGAALTAGKVKIFVDYAVSE